MTLSPSDSEAPVCASTSGATAGRIIFLSFCERVRRYTRAISKRSPSTPSIAAANCEYTMGTSTSAATMPGATPGVDQMSSIKVTAMVGSVRTTDITQANAALKGGQTAASAANAPPAANDSAKLMSVRASVEPSAA